ncbi:tRNA (N6-threonylcarbamoyladenosine(37)-N6)-methyltransferase TrmO [Catenovulum adriaticum]|uniref:tRNA (N6-threonylcarbamoyladenosine(37)-N6)-methyltransferase TrmO n=1 Tax=Catenovulum adriaticum TaxID=2984846 RepID=A0ABY7AHC6_9ALTE|nr:tRNA (N6-threonylcarbamoyladenosine(37)-N6)-methyltransferase TrmO [Catenovulum sp. TS8]WAJ69013.1 tRNA (N6-threonylcarbamoyladenosine(37)-N6)-methyltransferase TrmO [Catenovulum sp. TS8]
MSASWPFTVIGEVDSPFKEKFSVPRQPNLADEVRGRVVFFSPFNQAALFSGLEQYSHIWLQFVFDQTAKQGWKPSVRPPRLGGNKKLGVFATRSPFRPNPVGLSCVKLESVEIDNKQQASLIISGLDLVDKTPILDVKPYVPYADCLRDASSELSAEPPKHLSGVTFSPVLTDLLADIHHIEPSFQKVVEQVLLQDPRPAYHQQSQSDRIYGVRLFKWNVRWTVSNNTCYVSDIHLS